jgi:hypothetical protein
MAPPKDNPPLDASAGEPGEQLPLTDLETLLARPPSRRKRLWQLALVLAALVLALAALHGVLLSPPAPAGDPDVPTVSVTLLSNVNFGTLTVNGKKLDRPPPLTTRLPARGTTVITLNAPPFRPHTCRFTNFTASQDDPVHCVYTYEGAPTPTTTPRSAPPGGFTVGVFLMPDDLPTDQQSRALAAMSLPLSAPQQTTVHPGEYFATSFLYQDQITHQQATVPLLARASFEPSEFPGPSGGPMCGAGICPWGAYLSQAAALHLHAWSLFFTEALRWQISDAAGATHADVSIPSTSIVGMLLVEDAAMGWQMVQVTAIIGSVRDTVCQAGVAMLEFRLSGDVTLLHDAGVEGCELHAQVNGVDEGRYVWRFGVLLAADAQAHASQPDLPVAPAAEIAAVGG